MKNARKLFAVCLFLFGVLLLCSCGCEHAWQTATCTTPTTCTLCGETAGEPLGHQQTESVVQQATCGENGLKTLTCSICHNIQAEAILATGNHAYEQTAHEDATCQKDGKTVSTCTVCGDVYEKVLPATGVHAYNESLQKKATCIEEGTKRFTCRMCGEFYEEAIPLSTEHTISERVIAQPSCKEEGKKTCACTLCGYSYDEVIPRLSTHSYSSTITRTATCSLSGIVKYTCSVCGDSYTDNYALPTYSGERIYAMYGKSIGEVLTYNANGSPLAQGTCFVYEEDGRLLTNYHVIKGAASAKVRLNGVPYQVTKILAYDVDTDLAVLKIDAIGLTPLPLCRQYHGAGKNVFAFGTSHALLSSFARGKITESRHEIDGVCYVKHDTVLAGGDSGGPLFNEYGEVIGINTMTTRGTGTPSYALAIAELDSLSFGRSYDFADLPHANTPSDPTPTPTPTPTPDPNYQPKNGYGILVNYMMQQGQGSQVRVKQFVNYTDETGTMKFTVLYHPDTGVIDLILSFTMKDTGYNVTVALHIDNNGDGMYKWEYSDTEEAYMYGFLSPDTYTVDTLLQHTVTTVTDRDMLMYYRQFASLLISEVCNGINETFAFLGIDARDFGFQYFPPVASDDPVVPGNPGNPGNSGNSGNNENNTGSLGQVNNGVLEEVSPETMQVPENMKFLGTGNATEEKNADNITATVVLYTLDGDVVNWKTENDLIYVITKGNNRLVVINSENMTPIYNVPLAGVPAEINFEGDKIYISLPDLCKIDVFSKSDCTKLSSLHFEHEVASFCFDGDYIFYSELDQHCKVFRKNLSTGETKEVRTENRYSFIFPKIYLNKEDRILYIGESGNTGSALYYFDADTLALKSVFEKNDYGIMNHTREIFHIGDEIFWGNYRLSDTNARELIGRYGTADYGSMTFASDELVSTYEGLFLTDTYECVIDYYDADFDFEYILVSESYNVFFRARSGDKNIIIGINFDLQGI